MFTHGQRNQKDSRVTSISMPRITTPTLGTVAQLQRQYGNRAVGKMLMTSSPIIQRELEVHHSAHTENNGRSSHVEAIVSGNTLGPGSNAPSVDPAGWDLLNERFEMGDQVRGHLWNGRLGGPGDKSWNLTPLENSFNVNDMGAEEGKAQTALNHVNTDQMYLETNVAYGYSNDNTNAAYYYPSNVTFNWTAYEDDNGTVRDQGAFNSETALPDEQDPDYDPDDPDNIGLDETEDV